MRRILAIRAAIFSAVMAFTAMTALFPTGCTKAPPAETAVERRGQELYQALQAKDFERALGYYASEFFQGRPREQWKEYLVEVQRKLGDLQSAELKRKQADTRYSGKFFVYEYSVVYANAKAWETVTFFVPVGGTDVMVFGHQIKAKGI
jgi:hypothetical protein